MLKSILRKAGDLLWRRSRECRKPRLDPDFLNLLNSLIDWRMGIELARREAEQNAIWIDAFGDGASPEGGSGDTTSIP